MLLTGIVFGSVLAVILGIYWAFVVHPEDREQSTLRKRLKENAIRHAVARSLLKDMQQLSSVPSLNRILTRGNRLVRPFQRTIEQSGVRASVGTVVLASGCAALIAYLVVGFLTHRWLLGIAAGLGASTVPYLFIRRALTKRVRKFEELFPEAIDLIARALRAGHAFTTGLSMVAEEIPDPVGIEFKLLYDRQNYGLPLPSALKAFAERIPVLDAQFFVTAVLTQREAGGNLAEVLDNLSTVIRERFKVKRQVRVISAHGRLTGWILAALPPCLAMAMFIINPAVPTMLITDPLGIQMIIGAVILQIVGTLIIRKIVNVEY